MERKWTANQEQAIGTSGCNLLVSAGAGSGKTAVLTERIIRKLKDEKEPVDITRMLIVTFTKAAAGELKDRISNALAEAVEKEPENKHLAMQYGRADRANISTIDSFCIDLLRNNFVEAGLSADFRIADEAELTLLKRNIMNDLIEDEFSGNVQKEYLIENFGDFADCFTKLKNDEGLCDTFLGLYIKISSFKEGIGFIDGFAKEMRESAEGKAEEIGFYKKLSEQIERKLSYYYGEYENAVEFFKAENAPKTADRAENERKLLLKLQSLCRKYDFPAMKAEIDGFNWKNNCYDRKDAPPFFEVFKIVRGDCKEYLKEISDSVLEMSREMFEATAEILENLSKLLKAFDIRFKEERAARGILDFASAERLTMELLVGENGERTELAQRVAGLYDEIYIDEYQDVNSIQDTIFQAVSNGNNRFTVGDVKQSIYAFRGAEPSIFTDYREKYKEGNGGSTVFLPDNFRCNAEIVEFTNLVSEVMFNNATGNTVFDEGDYLRHSKSGEENHEKVKIAVIGKNAGADDEIEFPEAEYIASEIEKLLKNGKKNDGTPIKPQDIAILFRSNGNLSEAIENALDERKIPYYDNASKDFFENEEVLLMLCLLNVIDEPSKDIYLTGLLESPLYGFSLDELIQIRRFTNEGTLYEALREYTRENDFQKGKYFLEKLAKYRKAAEGNAVDKLIQYLYTDTGLPALVYGSAQKRANLTAFYEYARQFEGSSFKGLYNFIKYINDVIKEKASLGKAVVISEQSETVKIMTIHQSKGLEFPVCFIANANKHFNMTDLSEDTVCERSAGIATRIPDAGGLAKCETPVRYMIKNAIECSQLEEEMRILYVALTRAREKLYITATLKDSEKILKDEKQSAGRISFGSVMKNGGFLHWILTACYANEGNECFELEAVSTVKKAENEECEALPADENEDMTDYYGLVKSHFGFRYPHSEAAKLPAKMSVSKLYPDVLDEDAEPDAALPILETVPKFMQGETKPTAAQKGTATHLFMQFCDFTKFKKPYKAEISVLLEEEIDRLCENGFFTEDIGELINRNMLEKFFGSELFEKILAAKRLWREKRFNVKLPASDFTKDADLKESLEGEYILVQGVIDCFFENDDGEITVVDYKTDYIPKDMTYSEVAEMLKERYENQLSYYARACEQITAKRVKEVLLYSFGLGKTIKQ